MATLLHRHKVRAIAALAGVVFAGGLAASTVHAAPATATTLEGRTTVTTSAAVTSALVANEIVPLAVAPGWESFTDNGKAQLSFPITGGALQSLTGDIRHHGGINFVDFKTGKSLVIRNFDIVLDAHPHLTAFVPALNAKGVTIFDLDLSKARVTTNDDGTTVSNVIVTLDAGAASALNVALGTGSLFAGGMAIGIATVHLSSGH
jgi:hypothetical protein